MNRIMTAVYHLYRKDILTYQLREVTLKKTKTYTNKFDYKITKRHITHD